MNSILKELNPVQQEAVKTTEGPVLVIAGAGSGKTRVLTFKIAYLIEQGIPARNILALTFTNKAAREMKERIDRLTGIETNRALWMGTFHSIFSRILRRESELIGYPSSFTIYDTDDTKSLIKSILKDLKLDDQVYPPGEVLRRISFAKNQLVTSEAYHARSEWIAADESARKPEMGRIYQTYTHKCRNAGAMDFDDLLLNTYLLFKNHPEVLDRYRSQFRFILVDEYQDTNLVQYAIVNQLASLSRNLCVVGDDSQSIYSFRGARIENILNFRNDYPEYKIFKLEQNYRSTKTIVEAANSLISNNQGRIPKEIWSANETGDPVEIIQSLTDQEEGFLIANRILDLHLRNQVDFDEFAVLYRTHAQSRILEEACRKQNIPYKIYGSISFYQRKEVKDILAYFRLIVNHRDDESLRRIINFPARGIGKTTLSRLSETATLAGCPIWSLLEDPAARVPLINRGTAEKLLSFRKMIEGFTEQAAEMNAYNLAVHVLQTSGILEEFRYDRTPEGLSKFENIQELVNGMREFSEQPTELEDDNSSNSSNLDQFLQNVSLLTDQDQEKPEDRNKVCLMTIHSAKGLEFGYVFIAGVEEDLFPSQFSTGTAKEIEEERRLFYVAITRAMKGVFITHAQTRYRWGNLVDARPSRFIREIDTKYLRMGGSLNRQSKPASDFNPNPVESMIRPPARRIITTRSAAPSPAEDESFEPDNPDKLQSGMKVKHPRFGQGRILQIEGEGNNRKATVFFAESGQKQLLLRFARLKIVTD